MGTGIVCDFIFVPLLVVVLLLLPDLTLRIPVLPLLAHLNQIWLQGNGKAADVNISLLKKNQKKARNEYPQNGPFVIFNFIISAFPFLHGMNHATITCGSSKFSTRPTHVCITEHRSSSPGRSDVVSSTSSSIVLEMRFSRTRIDPQRAFIRQGQMGSLVCGWV